MCVDSHKAIAFASHQQGYNFPEHLSNLLQTHLDDRNGFVLGKSSYLILILSSWRMKCFANVYIACPDVLRAPVLLPEEDKKATKVLAERLSA